MSGSESSLTLPAADAPFLILYALREEQRTLHSPVRIACSGAGYANAARAANELIAACPLKPKALLIVGFAGGLQPEIEPGELIVFRQVVAQSETGELQRLQPDSELLAHAQTLKLTQLPFRFGTLFTSRDLLVTPLQKQEAARLTDADAVDMETAGAARVACELGIPWLAIRAVTDGANHTLPFDFSKLSDAQGSPHTGKIVLATLLHPWKIPDLIRLGKRSALAAENLNLFLEAFLTSFPER